MVTTKAGLGHDFREPMSPPPQNLCSSLSFSISINSNWLHRLHPGHHPGLPSLTHSTGFITEFCCLCHQNVSAIQPLLIIASAPAPWPKHWTLGVYRVVLLLLHFLPLRCGSCSWSMGMKTQEGESLEKTWFSYTFFHSLTSIYI